VHGNGREPGDVEHSDQPAEIVAELASVRKEIGRDVKEPSTSSLAPDRPKAAAPDYLGFAVPLRLRTDRGELRLMTTLTHFGTAVDVTVAELKMEAFLPADRDSAAILAELGGRSTA
jgi:MmyB-like transcription regulator ligand binding domain